MMSKLIGLITYPQANLKKFAKTGPLDLIIVTELIY
jgi:hypothetical protein